MPDYRNMTATEALRHAKEQSGKTAEEIAEALGVSTAVVTRYFRSADSYGPSLDKLPRLCEALGNTILVDWLRAQTQEADEMPAAQSRAEVLTAVARATIALGEVNKILVETESTGIDWVQAREIRSGLDDVKMACSVTQGMLEDLAAARNEGAGMVLASFRSDRHAHDYRWEVLELLSQPGHSSPVSRFFSRLKQKKYVEKHGSLPDWFSTIYASIQIRILDFAMSCFFWHFPEDVEIPRSAIDPDASDPAK